MSAAVDGAALVYLDAQLGARQASTWSAAPARRPRCLAGVVSIADQVAGHGLGLLNPYLYQMSGAHDPGILDVTGGTNTVTFPQGAGIHTVKGFDAASGYDMAQASAPSTRRGSCQNRGGSIELSCPARVAGWT